MEQYKVEEKEEGKRIDAYISYKNDEISTFMEKNLFIVSFSTNFASFM